MTEERATQERESFYEVEVCLWRRQSPGSRININFRLWGTRQGGWPHDRDAVGADGLGEGGKNFGYRREGNAW